jgi:hypothetical protein
LSVDGSWTPPGSSFVLLRRMRARLQLILLDLEKSERKKRRSFPSLPRPPQPWRRGMGDYGSARRGVCSGLALTNLTTLTTLTTPTTPPPSGTPPAKTPRERTLFGFSNTPKAPSFQTRNVAQRSERFGTSLWRQPVERAEKKRGSKSRVPLRSTRVWNDEIFCKESSPFSPSRPRRGGVRQRREGVFDPGSPHLF